VSALAGITAVQSNDFALGLPVAESLYGSVYPSYVSLVYVTAPVTYMLINPLGVWLCEHGMSLPEVRLLSSSPFAPPPPARAE
jgi:hypothetical protein